MDRKSFAPSDFEWKADKPGAFRATFATFNVVDRQGDVTLPGAIESGKSVVISAYEHGSSMGQALPVGAGVLGADDKKAWVDGEFFVDTTHGLDTYKTVKGLAERDLGEWSYGYIVAEKSYDPVELKSYPGAMRILKKQQTFEVSPVFIGAGIGTETQEIKTLDDGATKYADQAEQALASLQAVVLRSKSLADLRVKEGRTLSAANRDRLTALLTALTSAQADIQGLLDAAGDIKSAEAEIFDFKAILLASQVRETVWQQEGVI